MLSMVRGLTIQQMVMSAVMSAATNTWYMTTKAMLKKYDENETLTQILKSKFTNKSTERWTQVKRQFNTGT